MESTVGRVTRRVQVTANCENTLRQLRDKRLERIVWIDGVCIDQSGIYERDHQVGLMERIYEDAVYVEVCIQDLHESYRGALELFRAAFQRGMPEYGQEDYREPMEREVVRQLKALFERNHFGRVWVIQEVLFAKVAILRINQETVQFDQKSLEYLHWWYYQTYITIPRLYHWSSI